MANDVVTPPTGRSLGWAERLPVRKIVLTILTAAIFVVVGGGIYKTLTLPAGERLDWEFWANLFVIGLALGAVYALIALGYSLVYGILRMINFAHGEVFMFGAFASFFFARGVRRERLHEQSADRVARDVVRVGHRGLRRGRRAARTRLLSAAAQRPDALSP